MFRDERHRMLADLLGRMDAGLLADCGCWFAGGTAVSMLLGEYRRSDDLDFLCSSADGYRRLRQEVFNRGLAALGEGIPALRDVRADQYGIRCVLGTAENPVKFEIVREARIELAPGEERIAGAMVLARHDLYAEKLLANADRGLDRAALFRDFIDLCMMRRAWPRACDPAWGKAELAYGEVIGRMLEKVADELRKDDLLAQSLRRLNAGPEVEEVVSQVLQGDVRMALGGGHAGP